MVKKTIIGPHFSTKTWCASEFIPFNAAVWITFDIGFQHPDARVECQFLRGLPFGIDFRTIGDDFIGIADHDGIWTKSKR